MLGFDQRTHPHCAVTFRHSVRKDILSLYCCQPTVRFFVGLVETEDLVTRADALAGFDITSETSSAFDEIKYQMLSS
jgi:hypothetical protein